MSLVLDTSATLAWIYLDEGNRSVDKVLEQVVHEGAWVPSLWKLEVANVLEMGVRKGRHDAQFRDESLIDLSMLAIEVDPETNLHAWGHTIEFAERYRLTVYDAAYLELAVRKQLPLATLDQALASAAILEKVSLLLNNWPSDA